MNLLQEVQLLVLFQNMKRMFAGPFVKMQKKNCWQV